MKNPGAMDRLIRWLKLFVGLGLACLGFFLITLLERGSRRAAAETGRPCVVLITVDSLRADLFQPHVGRVGSGRFGSVKRIDELMNESAVFRGASTCTNDCRASLGTILTGHYPAATGLDPRQRRTRRLRPDLPTAAELFKDQGYRTAAFVNAEALGPQSGLDRGFDRYDLVGENWLNPIHPGVPGRLADETTDTALEWIDRRVGQPFFLLLHYQDPAADEVTARAYDAPAEWLEQLGAPTDWTIGKGTFRGKRFLHALNQAALRSKLASRQLGPKEAFAIWRAYLASVAFTDHEIGRLLDGLRERGLYDHCYVVLTGDHGEAFAEHGGFLHSGLNREVVDVPLSIKFPRGRNPWPHHTQFGSGAMVQTTDIVPTLVDALSLPIDTPPQGVSLMGLMRHEGAPRSWCYYVGSDGTLGMRDRKFKFLRRARPRFSAFYDLLKDPRELNNVSARLAREFPSIAVNYARILERLDAMASRGLPMIHRVADAR